MTDDHSIYEVEGDLNAVCRAFVGRKGKAKDKTWRNPSAPWSASDLRYYLSKFGDGSRYFIRRVGGEQHICLRFDQPDDEMSDGEWVIVVHLGGVFRERSLMKAGERLVGALNALPVPGSAPQ